MSEVILYDYWRSSASYRVRIALNLLGVTYRAVPIDLQAGDHRSAAHLRRNPQGAVPVIEIDGRTMTQSLAIIEFLHETRPQSTLLPDDAQARADVRRISYAIAMDIHPICNLHVANRVVEMTGGGETTRRAWMQEFISKGLDAVEVLLGPQQGDFCFGRSPTMADVCLVPQLYNARRWACQMERWPRLLAVEARCAELDAFKAAHPDTIGASAG